jgi:hypothetical protein
MTKHGMSQPTTGGLAGSGGGGGFSPTPWVFDYGFVNFTGVDPNDPGYVIPPGAPIYDPKREYILVELIDGGGGAFVGQPGVVTIDALIPPGAFFSQQGFYPGDGIGQITDSVNGVLVLANTGPFECRWNPINSGGVINPAITVPDIGPNLNNAFTGGEGMKYRAEDGQFVKYWQDAGADTMWASLSRQVIA